MSLISINRLTNVALSTCVKNTFCINKLKNSAEKDIYIHIHISSMPFLKGIFFSILSMSYITITWYFRELILQNQRVKELFELEGNFKDHLFQLPFTQQGHPQLDRLLRVLSSLAFDVSRDRASIVSLGNLFQWLTTLTVKDFFLFFSKLNSPSSFSLSLQGKCSISWIIFWPSSGSTPAGPHLFRTEDSPCGHSTPCEFSPAQEISLDGIPPSGMLTAMHILVSSTDLLRHWVYSIPLTKMLKSISASTDAWRTPLVTDLQLEPLITMISQLHHEFLVSPQITTPTLCFPSSVLLCTDTSTEQMVLFPSWKINYSLLPLKYLSLESLLPSLS